MIPDSVKNYINKILITSHHLMENAIKKDINLDEGDFHVRHIIEFPSTLDCSIIIRKHLEENLDSYGLEKIRYGKGDSELTMLVFKDYNEWFIPFIIGSSTNASIFEKPKHEFYMWINLHGKSNLSIWDTIE